MVRLSIAPVALSAIGLAWASTAAAQAVRVGRGSYTLTPPADIKLPPRTIFQTAGFRGKMPTNDWWSSVAWEQFSSPHFAHPLAMRADREGLRVCYPGAAIRATAKHVFASFQDELVVGHSAAREFPDARVDGFSDWFVEVAFGDGQQGMLVRYGHGSPFIYATYAGGGPEVRFVREPKVWAGSADAATLGVTVNGRHYALFGPKGSIWAGIGGRSLACRGGGDYFSLAVLPDDRPATLELFRRYAHNHVVDTRVAWRYVPDAGLVETTFTFETKSREPGPGGTLFALYPHQWANTAQELLPHSYASIRGPMKLAAGAAFRTAMRFPGVLPALPDTGGCDRGRLVKYLEDAAGRPFQDAADTYWQGKALGAIARLIPIAEQVGRADLAAKLRKALADRLENWFTAPEDRPKADRYFHYDRLWGAMIGHRPSFGSSDALNDHHFHYGYFVRAAAELARTDKAWAADAAWGGMVKMLVRDMCSGDRRDGMFPLLRCFDPYAGHSWASGNARFGDGNNQESSSEAMNAWTGVILWGEATGDRELRDLGIYLYTTELAAINAYWFDVEGRSFPSGYEQTCAAMIWGGKTDYATWFSGEPEHVHGIILLPIQSGSLYLGLYPDYVRRNLAGLARLRGGDQWRHWHDTLWPYEALADADKAMQRFESEPQRVGVQDRPFVYHWIGCLRTLGQVDRTVTADAPTAVTFVRGGVRTHVAWNTTQRPLTVKFSDGAALQVQPGRCESRSTGDERR